MINKNIEDAKKFPRPFMCPFEPWFRSRACPRNLTVNSNEAGSSKLPYGYIKTEPIDVNKIITKRHEKNK